MSWYEIPSTIRCFVLGFLICAFLASQGHAGIGIAFFFSLSILGVLVDAVRYGWRAWIIWTSECSFCSKRVSPLTRNRFLSTDLSKSGHWFCSPRCYMEFSRRFRAEGKLFNFLFERGE